MDSYYAKLYFGYAGSRKIKRAGVWPGTIVGSYGKRRDLAHYRGSFMEADLGNFKIGK